MSSFADYLERHPILLFVIDRLCDIEKQRTRARPLDLSDSGTWHDVQLSRAKSPAMNRDHPAAKVNFFQPPPLSCILVSPVSSCPAFCFVRTNPAHTQPAI